MKRLLVLLFSLAALGLISARKAPTKNGSPVRRTPREVSAHQKKGPKLYKDVTEEPVSFYSRESVSSDAQIKRKGVLVTRPQAKATVLICHGFMCDKYDVSFLHMLFNEYNSMTFDFRAHGEDKEGQCCTFGRNEAYEVIAAAEFIKNHPKLKSKPLFIYGFSMGAASAIIAMAQEPHLCDAMILDCPFDSSDKLLDRGIQQLKMNVLGYEMQMPGSSILRSYAYSSYVQSLLTTILRTFTQWGSNDVSIMNWI